MSFRSEADGGAKLVITLGNGYRADGKSKQTLFFSLFNFQYAN